MSTQGTSLVDTSYFQNLTHAVNKVGTCAELKAIAADALSSIKEAEDAIALELAKLQPVLALLTAPEANLLKIVKYIESLIEALIGPMVKPSATYAAQLTATAAEITALTTAIREAASRIGHCTVSLP